ncbi:MAG: hypothetical protein IPP07_23900 [Holophagales bacterium]|nr:hypothetical protein [Holophagales bacterium]
MSILLGWIVIETVVIRTVARRGAEDLLVDFSWLIPVVLLRHAALPRCSPGS